MTKQNQVCLQISLLVIKSKLEIETDNNERSIPIKENKDWAEIQTKMKDWFGLEILPPQYEKKISREIKVE